MDGVSKVVVDQRVVDGEVPPYLIFEGDEQQCASA
jgi:hypothetical protein